MSEPKTLWIRFPNENCAFVPMVYDGQWTKAYPTFEAFRQNFIRGWGELCEFAVQDTEPDISTKWERAPECSEAT
jgi:hypothetical protein